MMPVETPDVATTARTLIAFTRALNTRLRDTPEGTGMGLAEFNVLDGIDKGFDLSSTLVRKLFLDAPRVSRIVDAFVTGGCVSREPDREDRRRSRLSLTPAGQTYLQRGRVELTSAMEDLLSGLDEQERAGLEAAVPGMRRVLRGRLSASSEAEEERVTT